MRIIHFKILSGLVFSAVLFLSNTGNALMSSTSGGCLWIITTTTWSDGSETIETQLKCSAGGSGGSTLDPYATNFGGGAYSITDGLINSNGGGVQVASSSGDDVQALIDSLSADSKTEEQKAAEAECKQVPLQEGGGFASFGSAYLSNDARPGDLLPITLNKIEEYGGVPGNWHDTGERKLNLIPTRNGGMRSECQVIIEHK